MIEKTLEFLDLPLFLFEFPLVYSVNLVNIGGLHPLLGDSGLIDEFVIASGTVIVES